MTARRRAAVLGSPIRHSLSPVLHNAAYVTLGLANWSYEAFEVREPQLAGFLAGLGPEWAGLSLTMPLKRVALDVADRVSQTARAVGAANTLVFSSAGSLAENTDVLGMVNALREAGVRQAGHAVILGAGGTAQAAVAGLRELGCSEPVVLVRDRARAGELVATAERLGMRLDLREVLADGHAAARELEGADVVVSTLPAGVADPLVAARWQPSTTLLDVVYAPWPTALAAGAAAAGCRIASGLNMLLYQAVAQVELMTGLAGPVEAMRKALDAAVLDRS